MPDRDDANLFEILVGQVTQNLEINIILGKALSVLPETEPFEPVRNLLHRRPSTDLTLSVLDRHVVGVYHPRQDRVSIAMSALPLKADMCSAVADVRFGPIEDIAPAKPFTIKRPPTEAASHGVLRNRLLLDLDDEAGRGLLRLLALSIEGLPGGRLEER